MKRRIPYAVANYEEIVRKGYFFVDKTRFIREFEAYSTPVFLRPRRFGKSLWCSIQECYYDINRKGNFAELFGKTDIGRNPTPLHNTMLVMRFDFSVVQVSDDYKAIETAFFDAVGNRIRIFVSDYKNFADFSEALGKASAASALDTILTIVKEKHLPPVCIIVDEYDNFTNQLVTSRLDKLYGNVTTGDSFLRTFFKTIKTGVGEGSVGRVFITGVLPITIDDLTSGFYIGQVVSLQPKLLSAMGFTHAETAKYVDEIFADYGWDAVLKRRVLVDLENFYDGYRLLPNADEALFNSTICNFYLDQLLHNDGQLPVETVDTNLRTDVNWLRRLAGGTEETRKLLESLMTNGTMAIDQGAFVGKFNMQQFFKPDFFPISLYYLGILSFVDDFELGFPNLTVKQIFTEYYNELEHLEPGLETRPAYAAFFSRFLKDCDWGALFNGYWQTYVAQIPAQAFDKVNENFFRTTFYELCTRYLARYLSLAIEVNLKSGRCDFLALPRPKGTFPDDACVIEFKYYTNEEARCLGVMDWKEPPAEAVKQAAGYAADVRAQFPQYRVAPHVLCIAGRNGFRFW